jgi:hypothetical protein
MKYRILFSLLAAVLMISDAAFGMNVGAPLDRSLMPYRFKVSHEMFDLLAGKNIPTPDQVQWEIRRAVWSWSRVEGTDVQIQYDGLYEETSAQNENIPPGTILISLVKPVGRRAAGCAQRTKDANGKLIGGYISINTNEYDYVRNERGHLYRVIRHEVGHVLGLDHSPVSGADMGYRREEQQTYSALDDEDALRQLYPSLNAKGGTLEVATLYEGAPSKHVEVAVIDAETGIGRFNVTNAEGKALFTALPAGKYLVAGREVVPVGPCGFEIRPQHFLTTFYDGLKGVNDPSKAVAIEVGQSAQKISLPLISGLKRYDCYYGYSGASHYLVGRGQEKKIYLMKDQAEKYHRTETSGGVAKGTKVLAAGTRPGYVIGTVEMEEPMMLQFNVKVDPLAVPGPRVIYCENAGEYALAIVGFYIVERLDPESYKRLRDPM